MGMRSTHFASGVVIIDPLAMSPSPFVEIIMGEIMIRVTVMVDDVFRLDEFAFNEGSYPGGGDPKVFRRLADTHDFCFFVLL